MDRPNICLVFCIDCSSELALSIDTLKAFIIQQHFNDNVFVSVVLFGVEVCVILNQCGIDNKARIINCLSSSEMCSECDLEQGILGALFEVIE